MWNPEAVFNEFRTISQLSPRLLPKVIEEIVSNSSNSRDAHYNIKEIFKTQSDMSLLDYHSQEDATKLIDLLIAVYASGDAGDFGYNTGVIKVVDILLRNEENPELWKGLLEEISKDNPGVAEKVVEGIIGVFAEASLNNKIFHIFYAHENANLWCCEPYAFTNCLYCI